MSTFKVFFVLAAFVACLHADDKEKHYAIFLECAVENGLNLEDFEKGKIPSGPPLPEMLCTMKCTMEKGGILVDGKIQTEEVRKDPELLHRIQEAKIDSFIDCLKTVEISECSDMRKMMECKEAASS